MRSRRGHPGTTPPRYADEHGYVIVIVLALMTIALAMGAAALAGALNSRSLTTRDARARRAQQAADAGVQQQLYDQSEANLGSSYNFSGGALGLSSFLDCLPLQLNASLQVTGLTAYASAAGTCPPALDSGGTPKSSLWSAVDNRAYYQSEFFSNKNEVGGSGVGSVVQFPEIVSIGCDSATASTCNTTPAPASNVYSRQLALLAPTGPVQAIEGMGNVTISGVSALGVNAIGVVNGDVMAGGNITMPLLGVGLNTSWPTSGTPITPTFGFGGSLSGISVNVNPVHLTGGFCTAGSPSTACLIKRPAPSTSVTTCSLCATGITCASCSGGGYNAGADTFTLTGGTATFAAGDYVFCNFNATGGTINTSASSTTPVRIYILPPNQTPCSANNYTQDPTTHVWSGGNFNAGTGVNNLLTGSVNGIAGTLDPSGLQIYAAGDGSYDNYTTVSIGDSTTCSVSVLGVCVTASAPPAQAMVVYAPTSAVTVNTKTCVLALVCAAGTFAGSIVGDNVTTTALAITQDLDIGNYPIDSGANGFRVSEAVQCDTSVTHLSNTLGTDTGGC